MKSADLYPEQLRRIRFVDLKRNKRLVFLTSHFKLPAVVVAEIYRNRWQIELFFKWIKQHLKIKSFYGNSANAVKTQVWIDIITYLLIAITKEKLNIPEVSCHTLLHISKANLFEQRLTKQIVTDALRHKLEPPNSNQLDLFVF